MQDLSQQQVFMSNFNPALTHWDLVRLLQRYISEFKIEISKNKGRGVPRHAIITLSHREDLDFLLVHSRSSELACYRFEPYRCRSEISDSKQERYSRTIYCSLDYLIDWGSLVNTLSETFGEVDTLDVWELEPKQGHSCEPLESNLYSLRILFVDKERAAAALEASEVQIGEGISLQLTSQYSHMQYRYHPVLPAVYSYTRCSSREDMEVKRDWMGFRYRPCLGPLEEMRRQMGSKGGSRRALKKSQADRKSGGVRFNFRSMWGNPRGLDVQGHDRVFLRPGNRGLWSSQFSGSGPTIFS